MPAAMSDVPRRGGVGGSTAGRSRALSTPASDVPRTWGAAGNKPFFTQHLDIDAGSITEAVSGTGSSPTTTSSQAFLSNGGGSPLQFISPLEFIIR
ncbi:hypothetical protein Pyn_23820 [Prunus yedoensis var. nudiflora]|uniref:Uncharacterized protein n=1 Tax=Prunus yedoensis var. nudiflora TaxID=2094558 RepID=A0A314XLV1_PRUYE|nr:hypothetical protein Pyn_23820 [Prunus yedoensis var. nudiflora]